MNEILAIENEITECYAMIDHFVSLQETQPNEMWVEEIAFWRRMLQSAKISKRKMRKT